MKNITFGTCHFYDRFSAECYYRAYEKDPALAVETKLREGSIKIGKPETKPGQTAWLNARECRWFITESTA